MLKNMATNECVSDEMGNAVMKENCDERNSFNLWKLYPTTGNSSNETDSVADLKLDVMSRKFNLDAEGVQKIILDVHLTNLGYPAVAPGVSISIINSLRLINVPRNCFLYYVAGERTVYRCKVGRVLARDETVHICQMEFQLAKHNRKSQWDTAFNVTAFSATKMLKSVNQLVAIENEGGDGITITIAVGAVIAITILVVCIYFLKRRLGCGGYNTISAVEPANQNPDGTELQQLVTEPAVRVTNLLTQGVMGSETESESNQHTMAENIPGVGENAQHSNGLSTNPTEPVNSTDNQNSSLDPTHFDNIIVGNPECEITRLVSVISSADTITVLWDKLTDLARWLDLSPANRSTIPGGNNSNALDHILVYWKQQKSNAATLQQLL